MEAANLPLDVASGAHRRDRRPGRVLSQRTSPQQGRTQVDGLRAAFPALASPRSESRTCRGGFSRHAQTCSATSCRSSTPSRLHSPLRSTSFSLTPVPPEVVAAAGDERRQRPLWGMGVVLAALGVPGSRAALTAFNGGKRRRARCSGGQTRRCSTRHRPFAPTEPLRGRKAVRTPDGEASPGGLRPLRRLRNPAQPRIASPMVFESATRKITNAVGANRTRH